jgi:hypothetical protein
MDSLEEIRKAEKSETESHTNYSKKLREQSQNSWGSLEKKKK